VYQLISLFKKSSHQPGKSLATSSCHYETTSLEDIQPGEEGIISRVPENRLAPLLGLRPGKTARLITRQSFGGPIVVEIHGRNLALSRSLARQVQLECPKKSCMAVRADDAGK